MSGIHRFLTRRDRHNKLSKQSKEEASQILSRPTFHGIFKSETTLEDNHDQEKKVKALAQRLKQLGIIAIEEEHMIYALQTTEGDTEKAFSLLLLLEDSIEGIIRNYTPNTKLLGAENRQGVTCYLDALLFAMFARLDCFEAILYKSFNDEPRRKLAILLRLWVNLLRSGKLITTDMTKHLQEALAECGWEDAAKLQQQDASEAFTFITEKLELPLLTLKMDIYHTGKEDESDDHKFVNERLLEVAIPPEPTDGQSLTLEDCLEAYFNNMIEVKRHMARRNTASSLRSMDSLSISKGSTSHVETVEIDTTPTMSPTQADTPRAEKQNPWSSFSEFTESLEASRTPGRRGSIVRERFFPDSSEDTNTGDSKTDKDTRADQDASGDTLPRRGSYKKEVMMPAWQFFSLIPWYTDNTPTNDAQVAAHFSSKRPILGMCLKRYSFLPDGRAIRLNTHIDIPTEIGLPHFIQDDNLDANAPIFGSFKLSLQALVCHRGNSVDSGHYISLVRGTSCPNTGTHATTGPQATEISKHWMRFDDLAAERVTLVDIDQALKTESPYLLFYQILPIGEDPSAPSIPNAPSSRASDGSTLADQVDFSLEDLSSDRPSVEITVPCETDAPTLASIARRPSIAFSEISNPTGLQPRSVPSSSPRLASMEEISTKGTSSSRRGSRSARSTPGSRAGSQTSENRISATFSRFAERLSRDKVNNDFNEAKEGDEFALEIDDTVDDMKLGPAALENKEKRGRGRTKDRERYKGKSKEKSKEKGKKLDRECVVM
ncbi:Peptidase C19 ubiquitin carboxyl-terminal hydrolase 2 [Penicillium coprophilum]|uniref:Peptidase C19 ubiquitin carboxyl-terminal hydrolase 2 n=1 Tax=Penicillium coprophilum TaxID=36646 RepID=UPI0023907196|nr:Peptidase C19 ubiquitin carboxyl-terminal hydrolase 2 [Penicillium coprophilum]KAJ5165376.1 Peptidase C19 ubiquitin carboxyl-terminal hydrolase 2 [Penicillium coprophilum]